VDDGGVGFVESGVAQAQLVEFPGDEVVDSVLSACLNHHLKRKAYRTSELFTSSRIITRPWGCFRSTARDFLLRLMVLKYKDVFVILGFHSLSSPGSRQSLVSS
jgi:hypothetical protein